MLEKQQSDLKGYEVEVNALQSTNDMTIRPSNDLGDRSMERLSSDGKRIGGGFTSVYFRSDPFILPISNLRRVRKLELSLPLRHTTTSPLPHLSLSRSVDVPMVNLEQRHLVVVV